MTVWLFIVLVAAGSFGAGLLGSLTGLGGGLVIVPMLTVFFHVDIRYAIGASLVSVIATSSGAAAAYVREGYTNVRIGIFLEVATTCGALAGAAIAGYLSARFLAILFGLVLMQTAVRSFMTRGSENIVTESDPLAQKLRLASDYPTASGMQPYGVQGVVGAFFTMIAAGILSALLGIGSGIVKVIAMDRMMKLPFKVSTTTSNFMIGVTAAASAGVYLHRGQIHPEIAFPVVVGVLCGALLGARILTRASNRGLRTLFIAVVVIMSIEMLYKGFLGTV